MRILAPIAAALLAWGATVTAADAQPGRAGGGSEAAESTGSDNRPDRRAPPPVDDGSAVTEDRSSRSLNDRINDLADTIKRWHQFIARFMPPEVAWVALTLVGGPAARRYIRCGRPFCHFCKSNRQGREYCTQCLHIYVLGDGLQPEAKQRKLYEVERHQRRLRRWRRLLSALVPGTGQILRDRPGGGSLLLFLWFAAWFATWPLVLMPLDRMLGLDLRLDLLAPAAVPAMFHLEPVGFAGAVILVIVWCLANSWSWRERHV